MEQWSKATAEFYAPSQIQYFQRKRDCRHIDWQSHNLRKKRVLKKLNREVPISMCQPVVQNLAAYASFSDLYLIFWATDTLNIPNSSIH